MQIPSSAIAASISGMNAGKSDRTVAAEAPVVAAPHVESSEQGNADRDAQGQGDGIGPRTENKKRKSPGPAEHSKVDPSTDVMPAPTLPDEPPSQLDLIG